jgi:hypothetical protein
MYPEYALRQAYAVDIAAQIAGALPVPANSAGRSCFCAQVA